jgi:prevent-host-death family protein
MTTSQPLQQIGVRELKARLSEVLQQVVTTEQPLLVTSRGEELACLVPESLPPSGAEMAVRLDRVARDQEPEPAVQRVAEPSPVWTLRPYPGQIEISVRELKARASEVLRDVAERGRVYKITRRGNTLARLTPPYRELTAEEWIAQHRALVEDIAKHVDMSKPVSSVDLVNEGRDRHYRIAMQQQDR